MHGVYGHVSPAMRADVKAALQERWESALRERTRLSPRSLVPVLDNLLTIQTRVGSFSVQRARRACGRGPHEDRGAEGQRR
jgi:hypothetical protein